MMIAAGIAYGLTQLLPSFHLAALHWLFWPCLAVSLVIAISAIIGFKLAKTTINPHQPERTSHIVQTGIYAYSRNPMYLSLALLLFAWAGYLQHLGALITPILFVGYIQVFQIAAEERMLLKRFGASYQAYLDKVRPWL